MSNDFANEMIVAVSKAFSDKVVGKAKADLPQGSAKDVNFQVIFDGRVKKGEDSTMKSWSKTKYDVLAMLLASAVNGETLNKVLAEYAEILSRIEDPEQKEEAAKLVRERVKGVDEKVKALIGQSEVVRKGTVTYKGTVRIVEEPTESGEKGDHAA